MGLVLCTWGGHINTGISTASPGVAIDEWSNSLACIQPDSAPLTQARADLVASRVRAWFADINTAINRTVSLEWVKANNFSVETPFHQITDPTMYATAFTAVRPGSGGDVHPVTMAYRVSLDDGTRNKRARGGFYVPRPAMPVGDDGRFPAANVAAALNTLHTMLAGIETDTGWEVGVWSRAGQAVTAATRARIGDVPDNIRRRKNAMQETYQAVAV